MLVKLLPDQISKYWAYIKYAIEDTAPRDWVQRRMNNILESLLMPDGTTHAWLCCVGIDPPDIVGLVITGFFNDMLTKANIFRVILLYGYDRVPQEEWLEGWNTLKVFAKAKGCVEIDAFGSDERIIKIAKELGFTVETHIYKEI